MTLMSRQMPYFYLKYKIINGLIIFLFILFFMIIMWDVGNIVIWDFWFLYFSKTFSSNLCMVYNLKYICNFTLRRFSKNKYTEFNIVFHIGKIYTLKMNSTTKIPIINFVLVSFTIAVHTYSTHNNPLFFLHQITAQWHLIHFAN